MGRLHERLHGGLWHTTRPDRVVSIANSQSILVEPDIDNRERWNTAGGPENYPIARTIGGISLFDFRGFEPDEYSRRYPFSSWKLFVPHRRKWGGAAWFEIDRDIVADKLLSPEALLQKWKCEGLHGHNILPALEAAHIGNLPVSGISSAFLTWDDGREVRDFDMQRFDHSIFARILAEWHASRHRNVGISPSPPLGL